MKRMIYLFCLIILTAGLFAGQRVDGAEGRLYLHFFKSQVCPHCKQAEKDLPGILKRFPRITMVSYEVRNAMNQIDALNRQNMGRLIAMLQQIQARNGGKPFIYEYNTPHAFALVNGIPYYLKKLSETTTVKKEVPIPVFILGNRVFVGYQSTMLEQAIARFNRE
jgi:hypothetical protein